MWRGPALERYRDRRNWRRDFQLRVTLRPVGSPVASYITSQSDARNQVITAGACRLIRSVSRGFRVRSPLRCSSSSPDSPRQPRVSLLHVDASPPLVGLH